MSTIIIRAAKESDIDALCKLYIAFHEFHVQGIPDRLRKPEQYNWEELQGSLKRILHDQQATIIVAEDAGKVIGLAEVYLREDILDSATVAHTYGYLQSLMVVEAYRHHRIGSQLIRAIEQWAKEKGATEIQLDSWEFPEGPLHFYENRNYKTLKRKLVKSI